MRPLRNVCFSCSDINGKYVRRHKPDETQSVVFRLTGGAVDGEHPKPGARSFLCRDFDRKRVIMWLPSSKSPAKSDFRETV